MPKRHDENKDLKSFSRIGRVNFNNKTLSAAKSATIGIHLWGKIDYLTHYCGWIFLWDNNAGNSIGSFDGNKQSARVQKKAKKEPKLTDKTKVKKNKK